MFKPSFAAESNRLTASRANGVALKVVLAQGGHEANLKPLHAISKFSRKLITRDWAYFLENRLRERFRLAGVPLIIDFKEK